MITNLRLRNWRAYENLSIDLKPGTTFVVARNGVGKTSLIESARWAIFGDVVGTPETAIRAGTSEASVGVKLALSGGRVLDIERTLRRPRVRVVSSIEARLDGRELTESELITLLEEEWGASILFLSRTTFLVEGLRLESDPDLLEQLSRAFGISDLQRARDELTTPIDELNSSLKDVRSEARTRQSELADLEERVGTAAEAEAAARRELEIARKEAADVSKQAERAKIVIDAGERWKTWQGRMSGLLLDAPERVRESSPSDALEVLEQEEQRLTEALESRQRERAFAEGRLQAIEAGLEGLRTAEGTCPVCRRPLDEADLHHAEQGHTQEMNALREEMKRLDFSDLASELRELKTLAQRARALGPPPEAPEMDMSPSLRQAMDALATANQKLENAVRTHQDNETRLKILEEELAQLRRDLQQDEALDAEYRRLVLLETAQLTIDSVVDEALKELIAPMREEIGTRWEQLFIDRPDLQIEPSGAISRLVNGESLPFKAFSAGEQMSARLLLRLIMIASTTAAGFCWIDEPLEHLDPTTRRLTAGMLARGALAGGIGQMVVTTYEDDLARLLARESDRTEIIYVRTPTTV